MESRANNAPAVRLSTHGVHGCIVARAPRGPICPLPTASPSPVEEPCFTAGHLDGAAPPVGPNIHPTARCGGDRGLVPRLWGPKSCMRPGGERGGECPAVARPADGLALSGIHRDCFRFSREAEARKEEANWTAIVPLQAPTRRTLGVGAGIGIPVRGNDDWLAALTSGQRRHPNSNEQQRGASGDTEVDVPWNRRGSCSHRGNREPPSPIQLDRNDSAPSGPAHGDWVMPLT
jgi:hypothetical protein